LEEVAAIGAVGSVADGADTVPAPVFHAPQLSPLLAYLLSLAVVAGLLGLAWFLGSRRRRTTTAMRPASLKALGKIARASLDDVVGGRDWGDAIIHCYDQMSRVVDRQRGLNRPVSTTPAEFAVRLEAAGLPTEPVRRLTRLFESVRYGAHTASKVEISEAVSCLGTIADFCGMPA
jgi:hypothetical protein